MRRLPAVLALLLLAAGLASAAEAQSTRGMRTERVRFARGASGAVIDGSLGAARAVRYLVGVRAGQTLLVETEGEVWVQVYAPGRTIADRYAAPSDDGERLDLTYWRGRVSRSGDYQVVVFTRPGLAGADYRLTLSVR